MHTYIHTYVHTPTHKSTPTPTPTPTPTLTPTPTCVGSNSSEASGEALLHRLHVAHQRVVAAVAALRPQGETQGIRHKG